jgi:recombination protein RecA
MMHSNGISFEGDLLDLGVNCKVINRSGAWFKYGETYLGQGKEKARNFLIENPELAEEMRQLILASNDPVGAVQAEGAENEAEEESVVDS